MKPFEEHFQAVIAKPVKDLNLEYTTFRETVTPGIDFRPYLNEDIVNQKYVQINVMDGFNPDHVSQMNNHSIYHLYEYEKKTGFISDIPATNQFSGFYEMPTRFLLCRYVICLLDDAMRKHAPVELLAIRKNGVIYIGANKKLERIDDDRVMAAFGGLNFAKKVTTSIDPSFETHHSVVKELRLENTVKRTAMTIFISSVVRAFDHKNNVIELKTVKSNVAGKIQNLPGSKARSWWLRALLSGADRIVYGLRRQDMVVHEVHEADINDLTTGHFHFDGNELFEFVFHLFERIDNFIRGDGQMCLVRPNEKGEIITPATSADFNRSPFW
uniref:Decapping nuclease n=2 Tax=Caenorhabditis japonica TaxID=281687 RepID=A0A8R1E6I4_CAEJA